jgi:hypothetical protein
LSPLAEAKISFEEGDQMVLYTLKKFKKEKRTSIDVHHRFGGKYLRRVTKL